MPPIRVADSFIANDRQVSYFDLVLPLYRMNENGTPIKLEGTCFPIGRRIYLTAAHIFDGFEEARAKYKRPTAERNAPTLEEMVQRLQWMKEARFLEGADVNTGALVIDQSAIRQGKLKPLAFSLVTSVIMTLDFDLAVLSVADDKRRNPEGQESPIACFSLIEKPHVGQKIAVAGYPGESNRLTITEEGGMPKYSFGLSLIVNEGVITELHPVMRDLGHAFFPCLQTTADIRPGHSGGPAFCKETLSVVGVNSIGGIEGGMVSWVGNALDAELSHPHRPDNRWEDGGGWGRNDAPYDGRSRANQDLRDVNH